MRAPVPDNDDEPEAICANCQYWVGDLDGQKICFHRLSPYGAMPVTAEQSCNKFFPCFKRWPEADHG